MAFENTVNSLFEFIKKSPSSYHTVSTVKARLLEEGYTELFESKEYDLVPGGKYFVIRGGSSLVAFRVRDELFGFVITATHSDFPTFKIKGNESLFKNGYVEIPVEPYGGMTYYSWFDRPLSVAGRVFVKEENTIKNIPVNVDKDLLVIPSSAPHLNREINKGFSPNPAIELIPIISTSGDSLNIVDIIAREIGVESENILSHDLYLYVREEGKILGIDEKIVLCPRLDDLACVYTAVEGFLASDDTDMTPVLAIFDNEEVGSSTYQGGASTFLYDTLHLVAGDTRALNRALAKSLMVSADNAQAFHPNYPQLFDSTYSVKLNQGIAIKYNSNRKYATDGVSAAIVEKICRDSGIATQLYYNRADLPGGSTLGAIASTRVAAVTIDIGIPQLAMHSAVETVGRDDILDMLKLMKSIYSTDFDIKESEIVIK